MDWINDELSDLRIVLRNITEDLYDGQILAILMGMCRFHTNTVHVLYMYLNKVDVIISLLNLFTCQHKFRIVFACSLGTS